MARFDREAPEPPPTFEGFTPTAIVIETHSIINSSIALRDQLATSLCSTTATFPKLIRPLVGHANRTACHRNVSGTLLASVSPDPALREASRAAQELLLAADTVNNMRVDIASLVATVRESVYASDNVLDNEDRYLITYMLAQKALTEAADGLYFTRTELASIPEEDVAKLTVLKHEGSRDNDSLWFTFCAEHQTYIMKHARSGETRRKYYLAKMRRFPENVIRLEKMLILRDEIARLLGYENHAALKMEERMASSVSEVKQDLISLQEGPKPLAKAEIDKLLELKSCDIANRRSLGLDVHSEDSSRIFIRDWAYYIYIQRSKTQAIDSKALAEYFERPGKYQGAHQLLISPSVTLITFQSFTESNGSEVRTMFHELSHVIHHIVSRTKYALPMSRDFAEIPSLMLEHFTWVPEILMTLGKHYSSLETGYAEEDLNTEITLDGVLPRCLAEAVARTKHTNGAFDALTDVQLALFDLMIHSPVEGRTSQTLDTTVPWNRIRQDTKL
ncbi:hypothetical protein ACHAQJ_010519 [Trichoderma viride]